MIFRQTYLYNPSSIYSLRDPSRGQTLTSQDLDKTDWFIRRMTSGSFSREEMVFIGGFRKTPFHRAPLHCGQRLQVPV